MYKEQCVDKMSHRVCHAADKMMKGHRIVPAPKVFGMRNSWCHTRDVQRMKSFCVVECYIQEGETCQAFVGLLALLVTGPTCSFHREGAVAML